MRTCSPKRSLRAADSGWLWLGAARVEPTRAALTHQETSKPGKTSGPGPIREAGSQKQQSDP